MAIRRWLSVVLGVLLVLVLGMVALAGSCAYLVRKQVQVREAASIGDYEREATAILKRFDGRPPARRAGSVRPVDLEQGARGAPEARRHDHQPAHPRVLDPTTASSSG